MSDLEKKRDEYVKKHLSQYVDSLARQVLEPMVKETAKLLRPVAADYLRAEAWESKEQESIKALRIELVEMCEAVEFMHEWAIKHQIPVVGTPEDGEKVNQFVISARANLKLLGAI